jgi:hypothetical protein
MIMHLEYIEMEPSLRTTPQLTTISPTLNWTLNLGLAQLL